VLPRPRPDGIDKLSTKVFTLVDTDALDFMANYNVVLAGDVSRELSDGIKRTILSGIATGKSTEVVSIVFRPFVSGGGPQAGRG
jgi:hypothetical protein